ncbi:uncharacterized protein TNCV_277401 [Trichonephila clavipes]|uniref:Uncharacterized protein n=1 Tax=Trichonephila clavipes TaxID=2585209 RepID=A0A8X6VGQ0_TRICX|nr:uncharacterized protein TNCV_277401 [Trichonephila clavipes]
MDGISYGQIYKVKKTSMTTTGRRLPDILGFQECDEHKESWLACDAEDCGCQMLNDVKIVTYVQEESDSVDDETEEDEDNNNKESSKGSCIRDSYGAVRTTSRVLSYSILLLKRIKDLAEKK